MNVRMTSRLVIVVLLLCVGLPLQSVAQVDAHGWGYLIDKLVADGLDPDVVAETFEDPRVPPFTGVEFSPDQPREPYARYRNFLRGSSVALARRCRQRHADEFEAAQRTSGVSASVVAAIMYVETGCGQNTGASVILHRLARLAMANEPQNLNRNLWRFAADDGTIDADTEARLRARARYLEDTFYPEVRATFVVAERAGVSPLSLRGSSSGAFGFPQFLPTSYLRHGADGDGDGQVSLYNTADAAMSAGRYLAAHGWRPGLSRTGQRQVIWHYNRSDAYVDTVLALAARIDGTAMDEPRARVKKAKAVRGKVPRKAASSTQVSSKKKAAPKATQYAKRTQRRR